MTAAERRRLATLHLGLTLGSLLTALIVGGAIGGAGLLSGDPLARSLTAKIAGGIVLLLLLTSLPNLVLGLGLRGERAWAETVLPLVALLNLPALPIGTLVGGYSLYLLWNEGNAEP